MVGILTLVRLLWNPMVHYCFTVRPQLFPVLSQVSLDKEFLTIFCAKDPSKESGAPYKPLLRKMY
jgi:hypothetical protein